MQLFLVHDARFLQFELSPVLADCLNRRSFSPAIKLVESVRPRVEVAAARDRLTFEELPLFLNISRLKFDRRIWRHIASELLLYTAIETPSFPLAPELLGQFLPEELVARVHRGSREFSFDGVPYRPDAAGLHNVEDVAELATILRAIDPADWPADRLTETESDERDEELEFAKQRFADLRAMFESANARSQVIVCEEV